MIGSRVARRAAMIALATGALVGAVPSGAQGADASGPVIRWVVTRDKTSAAALKVFLDQNSFVDKTGLQLAAQDNYLLVSGSKEIVDSRIQSIRLLAFLLQRPRAHLNLNVRVVQITGVTNSEVMETAETIRSLVQMQRDEIIRTFTNLDGYLSGQIRGGTPGAAPPNAQFQAAANRIMPSAARRQQTLSVPAMLVLSTMDLASRSGAPAPPSIPAARQVAALPLWMTKGAQAPAVATEELHVGDAIDLKQKLDESRQWCGRYAEVVHKSRGGVQALRGALEDGTSPLPDEVVSQLLQSLELVERIQPGKLKSHAERVLRELQRRFEDRLDTIELLARTAPAGETSGSGSGPAAKGPLLKPEQRRALRTVAAELSPRPLAFFRDVAGSGSNSPSRAQEFVGMLEEYIKVRQRLDGYMHGQAGTLEKIDFERLHVLEASLNTWLRRLSEAMAQSLDEQFYQRYNRQLRSIANREFGRAARGQLFSDSSVEDVPYLTRELLGAGRGTDIFVSNTISMQFLNDQPNEVGAELQATLPSKQGPKERIEAAKTLLESTNQLNTALNNTAAQSRQNTEIQRLQGVIGANRVTFAGAYKSLSDAQLVQQQKQRAYDDAKTDAEIAAAKLQLEEATRRVENARNALSVADTDLQISISNLTAIMAQPGQNSSPQAPPPAGTQPGLSSLELPPGLRGLMGTAASAALPLVDPNAMVQALLAGGEAVTVKDSIKLRATPTIGFDASSVTLKIHFSQSLDPDEKDTSSGKRAEDHVVKHYIGSGATEDTRETTVTALSYEPLVLSTLTSSISYSDKSGGLPVLRKVPGLASLAGDLPFPPFKQHTRQRGVYQCSVIILEPVVIPTIEDLYVFHGGSLESLEERINDSSEAPVAGGK